MLDVEPWSVDDWLAETLLDTDWSPEPEAVPTPTPGLTFTPALTSLLAMPTLAPTPTFGLTFTPVPPAPADVLVSVEDDCVEAALCSMVEDEFTSLDCWLAETPLDTDWSPLPTFTPGLMFALALTSVFAMPTLASTPTLGLALNWYPLWAKAGPNAPITATAVRRTAKRLPIMHGLLSGFSPSLRACPECRKRYAGVRPCGDIPYGMNLFLFRCARPGQHGSTGEEKKCAAAIPRPSSCSSSAWPSAGPSSRRSLRFSPHQTLRMRRAGAALSARAISTALSSSSYSCCRWWHRCCTRAAGASGTSRSASARQ